MRGPDVPVAEQQSAQAPPLEPKATPARPWVEQHSRALVLVDLAALLLSGVIAVLARFGLSLSTGLRGVSYLAIALALVLAWVGVLALSRCYETRFLGAGPEEYRRVGNASIRVMAAVALISFGFKLELARGFVAAFLVVGTLLLLTGRGLARAYLRRGRRHGRFSHRVLVVGGQAQVEELITELCRDPLSGLQVVGACIAGGSASRLASVTAHDVPVVGTLTTLAATLRDLRVDTVAVAASPAITGEALRRLSYELEGTEVDLMVAPALTNVTGTRVHIRPMAGLPLLHLDEPELSGARQAAKLVFDLVLATLLVLLLLPLLVGIAAAVRLSSAGPALFTQERVGRNGKPFRVYKFRSMFTDAEKRLAEIQHLNEHDGVLFKVRNDPRITPVGRWLRKYSLDELPQLFNVLKGDMSLVGPRPPLGSEVERYEGHAHRRLLVRPGITGLWQVSGRSDLSWDDTVRLDLQYVENWSLAMDLSILFRTASAVLAGKGAY